MSRKHLCRETIAFIAFFSTIPIYSPNVVPLRQHLQNDETMGYFVIPMLAAAAIASAISFAHAAASSSRFKKLFRMYSFVSPFGYAACMVYFVLASIGAIPMQTTLVAICAVFVGLFLPRVTIRWGKRLEPLCLQQALFFVCITCVGTAAIDWIFNTLPPVPLATLAASMMLFGTFSPYVLSASEQTGYVEDPKNATQENDPGRLPCITTESDFTDSNDRHAKISLIPRFVSVLVPGLIGLSVFAFHMGVSREVILDSISTEILGNIIASLILVPLCFTRGKQPISVLLFSGIAPVAATALLSYMSIASDFGASDDFISIGIYAFFCIAAQISLALGIAGTHAREFSTPMIWSGFLALFCVFSILGLTLGSILSGKQAIMPQTIAAVYCAYLIIQSVCSLLKNNPPSHDGNPESTDEEGDYARRCEKLAESFSLSPREKEIATYLGRGHTCSYVAKALVISESTVYTHARNIYRKVGIQSKEDLIQILTTDPKSQQGK